MKRDYVPVPFAKMDGRARLRIEFDSHGTLPWFNVVIDRTSALLLASIGYRRTIMLPMLLEIHIFANSDRIIVE